MTQDVALALLRSGANVFLTGEPGAGKTFVVNRYVAWLREHGIEPAITASTGLAATHVGGMTIHAWSGIGIRTGLTPTELSVMADDARLRRRVGKASVLIVDEISMLDARVLDAVDAACRAIREKPEPFGGLQVVFVGDFFQLPPVARPGEPPARFAFQAASWRLADPAVCYLTEQHRQADGDFLGLLSEIRRGTVSSGARDLLRRRSVEMADDAVQTRLYAHNVDVDRVNLDRLAALPGDVCAYDMRTWGAEKIVLQIKRQCLSPERLALKVGAHVMFTKNHPEGKFVNGTLGEVVGFDEDEALPIVRTLSGQEIRPVAMEWAVSDGDRAIAKVIQIPLRLAWAITVHKSQGMTLDAAAMDLSQAFEYGQGYVALSRVRSSDGLHLLGWNERALQVHPEVLAADAEFRSASERMDAEFAGRSAKDRTEAEEAFVHAHGGSVAGGVVKTRRKKTEKTSTFDETLALLKEGKTVAEIAELRDLAESTVIGHLEKLLGDGKVQAGDTWKVLPKRIKDALPDLHAALNVGEGRLGAAFSHLAGTFTYHEIRMARLVWTGE